MFTLSLTNTDTNEFKTIDFAKSMEMVDALTMIHYALGPNVDNCSIECINEDHNGKEVYIVILTDNGFRDKRVGEFENETTANEVAKLTEYALTTNYRICQLAHRVNKGRWYNFY